MGWQSMEKDRENSLKRVQESLGTRVEENNTRLSKALEMIKGKVQDLLENLDPSSPEISHPLIKQSYLSENNRVVYPPLAGGTLTESDHHRRFQRLLDQGLFSHPPREKSRNINGATELGWSSSREESESYYYWKQSKTQLMVLELNRSAFLAGLVNELTQSGSIPQGHLLRLLDDRKRIFFQLGDYEPTPSDSPLVFKSPPQPLESWSWVYYVDPELLPVLGAQVWWLIAAAALSLLAVLSFLLWFLTKEIGRELREAGEKVSFVNQVSHELKTPLTNIRLYTDLLKSSIIESNPKTQEYIQVISSEADRLSRMIHNVLTFARNGKKDQPRLRITDVVSICAEVLLSFSPSFKARNLELIWMPKRIPLLNTDPDWIGQILGNMISNAEKYGASGKKIQVTLDLEENQPGSEQAILVLRVRDWGQGIPNKERNRIFSPFQRLTHSLTEGSSGAGLGLSISRDLARKLGGDLILEETTPGACFSLKIPIRLPKEAQS